MTCDDPSTDPGEISVAAPLAAVQSGSNLASSVS